MKKKFFLAMGTLLIMALMFMVVASGCGEESSQTPSEKIDSAIQKQKDIKKVHVNYDMQIEIKGDAKALGSEFEGLLPFAMGIKGGADIDSSGDKVKAKGNISLVGLEEIISGLAGASGEMDAETTLGLGMISSMFADMEFVLLDETLYLNLAGTWYGMDASSAGDVSGLGDMTDSASSVDQECIENALSDTSKFGSTIIMSEITEVGTEQINGADAKHYKANLDLDKALTELANVSRDCGSAEGAGALEAGKSELNQMFRKKEIEMWIDKDNNLVGLKVTVELDPAAIADTADSLGSDSASTGAEGLESIMVSLDLKMSNFGMDVDISKPSGTIVPMEDLLGSFGGSDLFGGMEGTDPWEDLGGTSTTGGSSTGTSTSRYSRTATTSSY